MVNISTGHKPKPSGLGGGAIWYVLTYLQFFIFLVIYNLCGASALLPPNFNEVSVMLLFKTARLDLRFYLFNLFAISPLQYKIAFRTDWSSVWHRVLALKIRSNNLSAIALPRFKHITSNLNILILFHNSHWIFDLDLLFKIRTNPGYVQNLIWGLRYSW